MKSGVFFISLLNRISACLASAIIVCVLSGCTTYYQQNTAFHQAIAAGEYRDAIDHLEKDRAARRGRNRLLYYLEKGTALHMAGEYTASNDMFENAYLFIEEFMRNYGLETLSFITNPAVVPYPGEDFERVQIHYFKALNHILSGYLSDALVECRRLNIKLKEINDRYDAGKRNHYSGDAFAWNLMGILFDASKEYNNAFISYRNAVNIYETDYLSHYNVPVPRQLILDMLAAAYNAGMQQDYAFYREKYAPAFTPPEKNRGTGDIIVFWNNGLGPIKTEDSLNFFLQRGAGGVLMFVNEEQDFWLPVPPVGRGTGDLTDLKFIRMALPRYVERPPLFVDCRVTINSREYELEKAQDLNAIAFLNLRDRMGRELGRALLRLALKYGIEEAVRNENEAAGLMVSIINALTEKADTRNWQTLPYHIHYARISLDPGQYQLVFSRMTRTGDRYDVTRTVTVEQGDTAFVTLFDPLTASFAY
jgi:uncharacterized protein